MSNNTQFAINNDQISSPDFIYCNLFLIKSKKSFFESNIPERNINKSLVIYLYYDIPLVLKSKQCHSQRILKTIYFKLVKRETNEWERNYRFCNI